MASFPTRCAVFAPAVFIVGAHRLPTGTAFAPTVPRIRDHRASSGGSASSDGTDLGAGYCHTFGVH
uniref:Uncharacterized protein n=1 Tax=mine drainage metagenome TaxID=410659 RepID=E6QWL2_9ZZZZ